MMLKLKRNACSNILILFVLIIRSNGKCRFVPTTCADASWLDAGGMRGGGGGTCLLASECRKTSEIGIRWAQGQKGKISDKISNS